MMIHWGLYSLPAGEWKGRRMEERNAYYEQYAGEIEQDKYVVQSYNKMQLKKGKKVKER